MERLRNTYPLSENSRACHLAPRCLPARTSWRCRCSNSPNIRKSIRSHRIFMDLLRTLCMEQRSRLFAAECALRSAHNCATGAKEISYATGMDEMQTFAVEGNRGRRGRRTGCIVGDGPVSRSCQQNVGKADAQGHIPRTATGCC